MLALSNLPEQETCWCLTYSEHKECIRSLKKNGFITGSRISKILGRSTFGGPYDPEKIARQLIGIEKEVFTPEAEARMKVGVDQEDEIREEVAKKLKVDIRKTPMAIWKQDTRFGVVSDGEFESQHGKFGVEIKCPGSMYNVLKQRKACKARGEEPPPIYDSHFDQMMMEGYITDKDYMLYVVRAADTKELYMEAFPVTDHFIDVLYPGGVAFWEKYIYPLLNNKQAPRVPG